MCVRRHPFSDYGLASVCVCVCVCVCERSLFFVFIPSHACRPSGQPFFSECFRLFPTSTRECFCLCIYHQFTARGDPGHGICRDFRFNWCYTAIFRLSFCVGSQRAKMSYAVGCFFSQRGAQGSHFLNGACAYYHSVFRTFS